MTPRNDRIDAAPLDGDGRDSAVGVVEVALLDRAGFIVGTNPAWDEFCLANDGDLGRCGVGTSYLDVCESAGDDPDAAAVATAIRLALKGHLPAPLSILVPCDAPAVPRIFDTLISSRLNSSGACIGATVTLSRAYSDPARPTWAPDPLPAMLRVAELVAGEVGLTQTLRRVVESARDVLGVPFAAIDVIGPDGAVQDFVYAGVDAHTIETELDVLAWLAVRPRFLPLPIIVSERSIGNFYIAENAPQRLTASVELLATALAAVAGIAIDNARLYQSAQQRRRWAGAAAALTQELVSGAAGTPLDLMLRHALRGADADLAAVLVPEDETMIRLDGIVGGKDGLPPGMLFAREGSPASEVMLTGKPMLLERPTLRIWEVSTEPMGPMAVAPLPSDDNVSGVLVLSRLADRAPFTEADLEALAGFTNYAGLALELARARTDREQLTLHDDRMRIATELHDHVVRQLFAVGMGLEGIVDALADDEMRGRVCGYIAALDDSIRAIRETIYQVTRP
jgi:GAF domain-containing protein